jgi:hypothetical protein
MEIKTELQKIRESLPISDVDIIKIARNLHLPCGIDPAGAPDLSYEGWKILAREIQRGVHF